MLRHVTVVALEQAVAAPLATRLLASDGARVIKLERPEGDFAREYDKFAQGASSYFTWLNYGKESCVIDLKKETDFAHKLISCADVVVQNLGPGSAAKLGLDSESLRRRRPELITMDISGYGPSSKRKAYDLLVSAEAGLCSVTGSDGGGPGRVGVSIADIATGRAAYTAIIRALFNRQLSGEGAALSVSLFDVVAEMMTVPLLQYRATGAAPKRLGLKHPSIAPYGAFRCQDGVEVVISCQNEREWQSFCVKVLQCPSLTTDERFAKGINRVQNRNELDSLIEAILTKIDSKEAMTRLEDADLAFGRLSTLRDLSSHESLRECEVVNELGQAIRLPAEPVVDFSKQSHDDLENKARVPKVGDHTAKIRKEFGYC